MESRPLTIYVIIDKCGCKNRSTGAKKYDVKLSYYIPY